MIVQWVRVLTDLPEVLGSVPSTHTAAHSPSDSYALFWTLWTRYPLVQRYTYGKTPIHVKVKSQKRFKKKEVVS